MKVSEIVEYLEGFKKSEVSGKGLGCKQDIAIRTATSELLDPKTASAETLCEVHFQQIKDAINDRTGMEVYVRSMPALRESLTEDGEFIGYILRTRLLFGEPGKCITQEQYDNLVGAGVIGS